jgi:hypothetical protein
VKHKGSWVNLDLGCGLAALSPLLPRGNGTIETYQVYNKAGEKNRRQAMPDSWCKGRGC